LSVEELAKMPALIVMNTLPNEATKTTTVALPACGFAEKRGSMINGKGRLQRLNRATRPPGNARDDWEILRDLLQAVGGGDSLHSIEDVFRRMSETVPQFAGLSLSKIDDLGVHILEIEELPPTHPQDEKAIEEAIDIQARRRAVHEQVHEARARVSASSIERGATPRR
jgi:NADH-quinone oxidoreductase subunit G